MLPTLGHIAIDHGDKFEPIQGSEEHFKVGRDKEGTYVLDRAIQPSDVQQCTMWWVEKKVLETYEWRFVRHYVRNVVEPVEVCDAVKAYLVATLAERHASLAVAAKDALSRREAEWVAGEQTRLKKEVEDRAKGGSGAWDASSSNPPKRPEFSHADIVRSFPYFYHMTHLANVPSIVEHGLMSHEEVHKRQLLVRDISNSEVQERRQRAEPLYHRSIHRYVPLYYNPKNPMLYVRRDIQEDIVLLKVSRDALHCGQAIFTDGNAASTDTRFDSDELVVTESVEVLCAKFWTDYHDGGRRRCAEVLVYPNILPKHISGFVCSSRPLAIYLEDVYKLARVEVSPSLFF